MRKSHGGCCVPPARRQEPPFEFLQMQNKTTPLGVPFYFGAVGGIRTLGPLLTATRFPVVLVMTSSIPLQVTIPCPNRPIFTFAEPLPGRLSPPRHSTPSLCNSGIIPASSPFVKGKPINFPNLFLRAGIGEEKTVDGKIEICYHTISQGSVPFFTICFWIGGCL